MWMLNGVAVWWPFWIAIRVGQFAFQYPISNKESPSLKYLPAARTSPLKLGFLVGYWIFNQPVGTRSLRRVINDGLGGLSGGLLGFHGRFRANWRRIEQVSLR